MADIEAIYTYEGTADIQEVIVGREITGHSDFVRAEGGTWPPHPSRRQQRSQSPEPLQRRITNPAGDHGHDHDHPGDAVGALGLLAGYPLADPMSDS